MPSQVVNDSASTPSSGITPKATKNSSAGSAIQVSERSVMPRPGPAGLVAGAACRTAGAARVVTTR